MNAEPLVRAITDQVTGQVGDAVARAPAETMQTHFGLTVRATTALGDRPGAGDACDGLSFLRHGVVLYAPTPYSRREHFTLAHELAHHLVDQDDEALDWLADQDHPDLATEMLSDRIAQRLLLPTTWWIRCSTAATPCPAHTSFAEMVLPGVRSLG